MRVPQRLPKRLWHRVCDRERLRVRLRHCVADPLGQRQRVLAPNRDAQHQRQRQRLWVRLRDGVCERHHHLLGHVQRLPLWLPQR